MNLTRVKRLQNHPGGECVAVLQNDRELPITRGIREVQERLQYPTGSEVTAFSG